MYIPSAFAESNTATLHDFIEAHSFGLLITVVDGLPFATHLPFLLDRDQGPHGTLVGHVARANPQWQTANEQTALAVFSGPHAYISPTWYEAENLVPTWNYTAVHATGRPEIIEDPKALRAIVARMVDHYESGMPQPWKLSGDEKFLERLLTQIVGFRIPIDTLEGKWKLNQNHPAERREKVITALTEQGDVNSLGIAVLMRELRPQDEGK